MTVSRSRGPLSPRALVPLLAAGLLGTLISGPGEAQAPGEPLDSGVRGAAVDSIAALVEAHYVVPDTGRMIAEHLRARAAVGAYDSAATWADLARMVTPDLRRLNGDAHLAVDFDPEKAAALAGAEGRVLEEERDRARSARAERERRQNYFIQRAERLEGNVGYLKIHDRLSNDPEAFEVLGQALRVLERTEAMILDLRGVRGGSAAMSNHLISHFTRPGIPSLRIHWAPGDTVMVRRTLEELPGPRRPEVPLYVLVDGGSASAAEDVAFVLQNLERAEIVGETTRGAGRNNRHYPAGHGLLASISISRVQDPATGREWEGVGVVPDRPVPAEDAVADAHLAALDRLATRAGPEDRQRFSRLGE